MSKSRSVFTPVGIAFLAWKDTISVQVQAGIRSEEVQHRGVEVSASLLPPLPPGSFGCT